MKIEATEETTAAAVGVEAETDEVVQTEEEAFDAAFEEATTVLSDDSDAGATDDGSVSDAEGSSSDDTGDSEEVGAGDSGNTDGDGTDDAAGTTGSADATGDEGAATEPEATTDAPTAREIALQAQIDELKASASVTKPVEEPEATAETPQPTLTAEESAKVKAYREEWGDVSEAEALIRKEENQVIVGYIFDQMKDVLAPLLAAHESRNGRDQYTDLVGLVPDYDDVRDKMVSWVDKLPEGINKKIYTEITQTGTPDEVAQVITAFKEATGYESSTASAPQPSAAPASTEAAVQKPAGSGATAKPTGKAAAALKVVKTVRSKTSTGGVDVNDFDGSFDEFAQKK
jgi:hypothetical protein